MVSSPSTFLHPSQAARELGVSAKALRLYERRGLLDPLRTSAGWRAYGPWEMRRAGEISALRALGLSLAEVARVLSGDPNGLEAALASHQATLEARVRDLVGAVDRVRELRARLLKEHTPAPDEMQSLLHTERSATITFTLPWPWGGETFELGTIAPLTFLTGPLGCGKTRLALKLAETIPGSRFVDLDRAEDGAAAARARVASDPGLGQRVDQALQRLQENGAAVSDALFALLVATEGEPASLLIIDMVEQGLDEPTQEALIVHLRRHKSSRRRLILMTRSKVILDLCAPDLKETIIYCPANHSPPLFVSPLPGAPGYDALATCLASPSVRARTEGLRARMG